MAAKRAAKDAMTQKTVQFLAQMKRSDGWTPCSRPGTLSNARRLRREWLKGGWEADGIRILRIETTVTMAVVP